MHLVFFLFLKNGVKQRFVDEKKKKKKTKDEKLLWEHNNKKKNPAPVLQPALRGTAPAAEG